MAKKKKLDIVYCPECGDTIVAGKLVFRTNGNTGKEFLGCSNYPACKYTEEIEDDVDPPEGGWYDGDTPPWDLLFGED